MFPREKLREAPARGAPRRAPRGRWRRSCAELRPRRFELVVDFHSILKSGAPRAREPGRRGASRYARPYGREGAWLLRERARRLEPPRASRFERNEALVRFLGVEAPPAPRPARVEPGGRGAHRSAARRRAPAPVAIHPGTSDATPHKRWTAEGYARGRARAARSPRACRRRERRARARRPRLRRGGGGGGGRRGAARAADARPRAISPLSSRAPASTSGATPGRCTWPPSSGRRWCSSSGRPIPSRTRPGRERPRGPCASRSPAIPCRRGCAAAPCMRVVPPPRSVAAARGSLATRGAPGASVRRARKA